MVWPLHWLYPRNFLCIYLDKISGPDDDAVSSRNKPETVIFKLDDWNIIGYITQMHKNKGYTMIFYLLDIEGQGWWKICEFFVIGTHNNN